MDHAGGISMMDFYLLRHGKTKYNEKGLLLGKTDVPLLSREDPDLLKWIDRLVAISWVAMFHSGMKRSEETLREIYRRLDEKKKDIPIYVDERLQEMNFGEWELKSYDWLYQNQREDFLNWLHSPYDYAPPQGETLAQMEKRVISFFEEWASKELIGSILLVTHGGLIRLLWSIIHQTSFYEKKVEIGSLFRLNWQKRNMEEILE
ncbi:histidine phosphatase family protein [Petrotoga sp. DB-2]